MRLQLVEECRWRLKTVRLVVPSGTSGRETRNWRLRRRNKNESARNAERTRRRWNACVRWPSTTPDLSRSLYTVPGLSRSLYANKRSLISRRQSNKANRVHVMIVWYNTLIHFFCLLLWFFLWTELVMKKRILFFLSCYCFLYCNCNLVHWYFESWIFVPVCRMCWFYGYFPGLLLCIVLHVRMSMKTVLSTCVLWQSSTDVGLYINLLHMLVEIMTEWQFLTSQFLVWFDNVAVNSFCHWCSLLLYAVKVEFGNVY